MPRIAQLKTFDGALWARIEMDVDPKVDGAVHLFTDKEVRKLKDRERKDMWAELEAARDRWSD